MGPPELLESAAGLLAYALTQLGTLLGLLSGSPAGAAELVAVAASTGAALLAAAAVAQLAAPATGAPAVGPAAPVRWRERSHQLRVPRTCDPDAPGRQRPRAPSAPAPVT